MSLILDDGLQPSVARKKKRRERTAPREFKPFAASKELADYQNSTTARARSMYLNRLIREKAAQR